MKNQYLAMLPLDNTSEPFLDSFMDIQIEVGYLVWMCMCSRVKFKFVI